VISLGALAAVVGLGFGVKAYTIRSDILENLEGKRSAARDAALRTSYMEATGTANVAGITALSLFLAGGAGVWWGTPSSASQAGP
jgi:hypothetical protein